MAAVEHQSIGKVKRKELARKVVSDALIRLIRVRIIHLYAACPVFL